MPKGYFCWIYYGLTGVFFQHLKNISPLTSDFMVSKIISTAIQIITTLKKCVISLSCFQDWVNGAGPGFLVFRNMIIMCLDMDFFRSVLFSLLRFLYLLVLLLPNLEHFQTFFLQIFFSLTLSLYNSNETNVRSFSFPTDLKLCLFILKKQNTYLLFLGPVNCPDMFFPW